MTREIKPPKYEQYKKYYDKKLSESEYNSFREVVERCRTCKAEMCSCGWGACFLHGFGFSSLKGE